MAKNRLILVTGSALALLFLLFLLIVRIYSQHSFYLGAYSPQYLTCTVDPPTQIKEKILYETHSQNFSFAFTQAGVYRKKLVSDKWSLLNCPLPIESGHYIRITPHSDNLVSFPGNGLYLSSDAGLTWTVVYSNISFGAAFINKENVLYVAATPPTNYFDFKELYRYLKLRYYGITPNDRDKVLLSKDFGKTWIDITGNIPAGIRINRIDEDMYNSNSVCLEGWAVRQYSFQVATSNFGNYNWTKIALGECQNPNNLLGP